MPELKILDMTVPSNAEKDSDTQLGGGLTLAKLEPRQRLAPFLSDIEPSSSDIERRQANLVDFLLAQRDLLRLSVCSIPLCSLRSFCSLRSLCSGQPSQALAAS